MVPVCSSLVHREVIEESGVGRDWTLGHVLGSIHGIRASLEKTMEVDRSILGKSVSKIELHLVAPVDVDFWPWPCPIESYYCFWVDSIGRRRHRRDRIVEGVPER